MRKEIEKIVDSCYCSECSPLLGSDKVDQICSLIVERLEKEREECRSLIKNACRCKNWSCSACNNNQKIDKLTKELKEVG